MLTGLAYNIVEKAIAGRIARGEDIEEVVRHYTKLSEEQMEELILKYQKIEAEKVGTIEGEN